MSSPVPPIRSANGGVLSAISHGVVHGVLLFAVICGLLGCNLGGGGDGKASVGVGAAAIAGPVRGVGISEEAVWGVDARKRAAFVQALEKALYADGGAARGGDAMLVYKLHENAPEQGAFAVEAHLRIRDGRVFAREHFVATPLPKAPTAGESENSSNDQLKELATRLALWTQGAVSGVKPGAASQTPL